MTPIRASAVLFAMTLGMAAPARALAPAVVDSMPAWLATLIADDALVRSHWGIAVYDLDAERWLVELNADRFFVPASNLKLVVSAVALDRLGPAFTYRTSVYGTAPIGPAGTLDGDLVLYGRGDPNLSGRYARSMTAPFEDLADSLVAHGLRRITGAVVGDGSYWDHDALRGDWTHYDVRWWYAAPVGALGFNDNSIDFHVEPGPAIGTPPRIRGEPKSVFYELENRATTGPGGSENSFDFTREPGTNRIVAYGSLPLDRGPRVEYFAVVDPAGWAATVFREILTGRGVEVERGSRSVTDPAISSVWAGDTVALGAHASPPLERVIDAINGRSQNWHAEQLLKTLGREVRGEGSWRAGLALERETLAALGIDTTGFLLRDASGLSAANQATARGFVNLLRVMESHRHADAFRGSLPVAAESGSLRRRFRGGAGAGRVLAKTGYIENVYALSGYMTTLSGRRLAFSILVNQTRENDATAAIDRIVGAFVRDAAP